MEVRKILYEVSSTARVSYEYIQPPSRQATCACQTSRRQGAKAKRGIEHTRGRARHRAGRARAQRRRRAHKAWQATGKGTVGWEGRDSLDLSSRPQPGRLSYSPSRSVSLRGRLQFSTLDLVLLLSAPSAYRLPFQPWRNFCAPMYHLGHHILSLWAKSGPTLAGLSTYSSCLLPPSASPSHPLLPSRWPTLRSTGHFLRGAQYCPDERRACA